LNELKKAITMKIIKPFIEPSLFRQFKKKSGGGILLYGPPGCGKTFLARATAGECKARFQAVHITDVLDPYFGQSERNMRDIFSVARSQRPCILFFDEIDALGFSRTKVQSDLLKTVVDQLLSEIEGVDSNTEQILLIGATNMPWDVDPALRRPGRFDKTLFVAPPDEEARQTIFKLKLDGRPCEAIDYKILANRTELYSGADIENVVELAAENILDEIMSGGSTERKITTDDLLAAIRQSTPTTLDWLRTIENFIKYSNQSGLYDEAAEYLRKHRRFL
jgi:SpoVK/Ycf46/Vps4 family AAA+-type ATPase